MSGQLLATPLLREGVGIGGYSDSPDGVRPFSDKHTKLFRDLRRPGLTAIENVRSS